VHEILRRAKPPTLQVPDRPIVVLRDPKRTELLAACLQVLGNRDLLGLKPDALSQRSTAQLGVHENIQAVPIRREQSPAVQEARIGWTLPEGSVAARVGVERVVGVPPGQVACVDVVGIISGFASRCQQVASRRDRSRSGMGAGIAPCSSF
jgi:hypothetical protein